MTKIKPSFAENPEDCVTVWTWSLDEEVGLKCIFPFTLDGVTFNECTTYNSEWPRCSTKVDDDGVHVDIRDDGNFNWGYCSDDCPVEGKNKLFH